MAVKTVGEAFRPVRTECSLPRMVHGNFEILLGEGSPTNLSVLMERIDC